jgi:hypothetical protein
MRPEQLLRLFPRGWRARYGDEFLAVAGNEHLGPRQMIDIAACAIDAWTSSEVRRATREFRSDGSPGEQLMSKTLMTSCGSAGVALNRRDAWLCALAMIGGSFLFSIVGILAKRSGFEAAGETLVSIAFTGSLLLAMPFTYLKGKSWRAQLLLVGLPLLLLVLISLLAQLI